MHGAGACERDFGPGEGITTSHRSNVRWRSPSSGSRVEWARHQVHVGPVASASLVQSWKDFSAHRHILGWCKSSQVKGAPRGMRMGGGRGPCRVHVWHIIIKIRLPLEPYSPLSTCNVTTDAVASQYRTRLTDGDMCTVYGIVGTRTRTAY